MALPSGGETGEEVGRGDDGAVHLIGGSPRHIFEDDKRALLTNLANYLEHFIGVLLFF